MFQSDLRTKTDYFICIQVKQMSFNGMIREVVNDAGSGDIKSFRNGIGYIFPNEVDQWNQNFMRAFLGRIADLFETDENDPDWEKRLPIIIDILQSRGFRVSLNDFDYPFRSFPGCMQRINFINFLENISLWFPKKIFEYREELLEKVQPDIEQLNILRRLPSIPFQDLLRSEKVFSHFTKVTNFDVHNEELNVLRGEAVSGYIPKQKLILLRQMEDFFSRNSPLSSLSYVYRGLRLSNLESLNMDPDSVTFVSWDLDKSMNYFLNPASEDDRNNEIPVLLAIQLNPGMPVIRTKFTSELILPSGSYFEQIGEPIFLKNIFCREDMKDKIGAILHVQCLPKKRTRMQYLYKNGIPVYKKEDQWEDKWEDQWED